MNDILTEKSGLFSSCLNNATNVLGMIPAFSDN